HTNIRYRGVTNFRYWLLLQRKLIINDIFTLNELLTFVKQANGTYGKATEKDLDDRIFALIWALYILEPVIAKRYFEITADNDEKHIKEIRPQYDRNEFIKRSPLLTGVPLDLLHDPSRSPDIFLFGAG